MTNSLQILGVNRSLPWRPGSTVLSILWPSMTGNGNKAEVDNGVAYTTETVGFHGKTRILLRMYFISKSYLHI